jgi:hypothetical protein
MKVQVSRDQREDSNSSSKRGRDRDRKEDRARDKMGRTRIASYFDEMQHMLLSLLSQ